MDILKYHIYDLQLLSIYSDQNQQNDLTRSLQKRTGAWIVKSYSIIACLKKILHIIHCYKWQIEWTCDDR